MSSKRGIKKEKEIFLEKFKNVGITNFEMPKKDKIKNFSIPQHRNDVINTPQHFNENFGDSSNLSLNEKLKNWYTKYRPPRKCVEELVSILKEEKLDIHTFYKCHINIKPDIEKTSGGSLLYIGLCRQFEKLSQSVAFPEQINIDINIDEMPLFKSSKTKLWPVLIRVNNIAGSPVFPIAVFLGNKKPNNLEEYLEKFVNEME